MRRGDGIPGDSALGDSALGDGALGDGRPGDGALVADEHDDFDPMEAFVGAERLERLDRVIALRTRNLALVLEDILDPHNAAACLRSAEAFGVQDVHIIEGAYRFEPSRRVAQGAYKWLHLHRHADTASCLAALRSAGYHIYASDLGDPCAVRPIDAIDFGERVALAFGNEHAGASRTLVEGADATFVIPMRGFSQSFNVSVAVALSLYHGISKRIERFGPDGDLPGEERDALRGEWMRLAVKRGDRIAAAIRERASGDRSGDAEG